MSAVSIVCLILVALVLFYPIALIIKGAIDRRRATRPVSYYPPRGYTPIDVMIKYCGKKAKARDMFSAMTLYWASRGFITIEEDCKRGLKLTKLKPLEPADGVQTSEYCQMEWKLFNAMFSSNDVFYTLAATDAYEKDFENFMASCESKAEKTATPLSDKLSIASLASAIALLAVVTVIYGVALKDPLYVAGLFPFVGILFMRFAYESMDQNTAVRFFMYPFFALWSGLPTAAVVTVSATDGGIDCGIVYALTVLVTILVVFWLSRRIDLRSDADIKIYGEIDAFKTFLVQAEKDRLETLVCQDPEYFYNVLPYFYVLGISKIMKKKFDRVVLDGPSWYLGDLRDTLMF